MGLNVKIRYALTSLVGLLLGVGLLLAAVGGIEAQSDEDTESCELRGHPLSERWSNMKGTPDTDRRDIVGKEPDDVTFRKDVSYEFTVVCSGDDAPSEVYFGYETLDAPFSTSRNGWIQIREEDEDVAPSLAVLSVWTGSQALHTFANSTEGVATAQNASLPGVSTLGDFDDNDVCGAVKKVPADDARVNSDRLGNYSILTTKYMVSLFAPSAGNSQAPRLFVTFCSRGSGNIKVVDYKGGSNLVQHSKNYRITHSRLAVALDNSPGGPVAAQVLLSLLSGLLFWAASGPVLGGIGGAGRGSPMQPFAGLVGLILGAMALPVFGYGSWFWAGAMVVLGVLFGYFYATMISAKT